jgi:hypothetical protein
METTQTLDLIAQAKKYTYAEYRALQDDLLEQGPEAHPTMFDYINLNVHRMKRLDKTVELLPEVLKNLDNLTRPLAWVVITEGWCGDAAQNVPVLEKITEASNGKITLELVLRDQNLELMDLYLTNGGRSIPKLICFDAETKTELGTWGPRPAPAQELFMKLKADGLPKAEFIAAIHAWYASDKTHSVQLEIAELLLKSIQ